MDRFSQLAIKRLPVFLLWLVPATASLDAAGLCKSENFLVTTQQLGSDQETQQFAQQVLDQAELHRERIALEWLGEPLPPSVGRAIINVSFSQKHDRGRTWPIDSTAREYHNIYLDTMPQLALSTTLAHEITHVILATRYPHPDSLPAWIEEGIASRYDDAHRGQTRTQIVGWWHRTGNWPSIPQLLTRQSIGSDDKTSYALASSVVDFLLDRGDARQLLRFAKDCVDSDPDAALRQHYAFGSVSELQRAWQSWVAESPKRQVSVRSSQPSATVADSRHRSARTSLDSQQGGAP